MRQIVIIYLFGLSFFGFSQEEWKLPTTSSLIYYKFQETFEETNKELCQVMGMDGATSMFFNGKIMPKCQELATNHGNWLITAGQYAFHFALSPPPSMKCNKSGNDTLVGTVAILIPPKFELTRLYNIGKDKVVTQTVKFRIQMILIGKNEYLLKLKGFTLETMSRTIKSSTGVKTNEYDLGKLYSEFESADKQKKELQRFYTDINTFANSVNSILREIIEREIALSNLD